LLIGIDVGNTNITVGVFDDDASARHAYHAAKLPACRQPERAPASIQEAGTAHTVPPCIAAPLFAWRFTTKQYMTADEIAAPLLAHLAHAGIATGSVCDGVVACVVPVLERPIRVMLEHTFGIRDPLFVDHTADTGIAYDYPNPAEIGADRIVNAAAGIALYGTPLLIVDFGTATTFCCISAEGRYLGGQILPGVEISLQALTNRAAKLRSISIAKPAHVIGKSTEEGMAAGFYYQTLGALELITRHIKEEMCVPDLTIIATGGLAGLFSAAWPAISTIDQDLTLKGLKLIHERRAARSCSAREHTS
jgi:type III pantothenate kinase